MTQGRAGKWWSKKKKMEMGFQDTIARDGLQGKKKGKRPLFRGCKCQMKECMITLLVCIIPILKVWSWCFVAI